MNYDYNPNDLVGNDINNMIEQKLTNTNYSENFENIEGNDIYEDMIINLMIILISKF